MEAAAQTCVLEQQTGGLVFEAEPFFPLRCLVLDAALCHSHSQYTLLSISIITAPQGRGGEDEGEIYTLFVYEYVCVCCMNVAAFVPKKIWKGNVPVCTLFVCERMHVGLCVYMCVSLHAHHLTHRGVCVCVRVCASQPSVVFSSSLTVIPLSAICPSLKHQLFSKGPLGEKETTG